VLLTRPNEQEETDTICWDCVTRTSRNFDHALSNHVGGATSPYTDTERACVKYYTTKGNNMTVSMVIVIVGVAALVAVGTIMAIIATWEF
jgi:hypothetical protein